MMKEYIVEPEGTLNSEKISFKTYLKKVLVANTFSYFKSEQIYENQMKVRNAFKSMSIRTENKVKTIKLISRKVEKY